MTGFQSLTPAEMLQSPWILGPAAFVLWVAAGLVVRRLLLAAMRRIAARTRWSWDDVLAQSIGTPLVLAILASGLLVLGRILPLSPEWDRAFDVLLAAAIALALVLFADRFARGILDRLAPASPVLRGAQGLILGGLRGVILALGLLIFLDSIGISITPILASLGVGSLAVALALQETLANLFAGIHIIVDKPIEPGHYIRVQSGEEGLVLKVGWRSTWIRLLAGNVLVIPNSNLARSSIINYNLPDSRVWLQVSVGVHYDSDLEQVERITLEVARQVLDSVPGAAPDAVPQVRFSAFGDSAIVFGVSLWAASFEHARTVQHEFIKRLSARFRQEGIVIPYPIRTLDIPPVSAAALRGAGAPPAGGIR